MTFREKTMKSDRIYEGRVVNLRVDTVELPDKKYSKREIVEHPGAVAVVPITNEKEIILVRQFRKPVEEILLEIPAGKIEPKEDPYKCALRELEEETGYTADSAEKLLEFYTTPGFSNEVMHIYLAENLKEGVMNLDEDENIEVVKMPIGEAIEMVKAGQIKDAKTIVGILLYSNIM